MLYTIISCQLFKLSTYHRCPHSPLVAGIIKRPLQLPISVPVTGSFGSRQPFFIPFNSQLRLPRPLQQFPKMVIRAHIAGICAKYLLKQLARARLIAQFYVFQRQRMFQKRIIRVGHQECFKFVNSFHLFPPLNISKLSLRHLYLYIDWLHKQPYQNRPGNENGTGLQKIIVMKILVCISKTPDTTAKIAFTDNNTKFAQDGVQWIINPYDEWYALVRAIELKEKDPSIVLHLVTVAGADTDPVIRKALALGGDEAIRINADSQDSFYIASQIAEVAKQGGYDLIFTGKETIDYNGSSIGGMVAELLNLPYVSLATKFDLNGTTATITREIEGGEEICEVQLPVAVSCQKGMAEQRIPNMKGIMGARTKPLKVVEPAAVEALTSVVSFELPPAKAGVKLIPADNPAELVRLLHEEAKLI